MKNLTDSFVYLGHWPSAGSFGFNTDILVSFICSFFREKQKNRAFFLVKSKKKQSILLQKAELGALSCHLKFKGRDDGRCSFVHR
jgi:hypothetical protein